ncbi:MULTISPECIES: UPF0158 family protein [unclassified Lentimicrobium]|uniref:UPF0158 family protein n=1 Tax=unclassified Lentimicrobium TaxID=2677434 RepID=UPI0015522783|nr:MULTISPECIES: UPF0158 family protein [unclassified Lentimicrobium]NPD44965.1 hypothetical protein [Lentimicrobium sp. S6]NPD83471.1 hypothetical protein [Lentimicrobium sp. L6]
MQKYINQLIEDLIQVAKNPPPPSYIEAPPHIESEPVIAELALTPFMPISKIVGIEESAFPPGFKLSSQQCIDVIHAVLQVFEALNIELIDQPEDIPPELLYEAIISCWDQEVQYLPNAGMDLELCTGDQIDCPYGEFCSCNEEFDEEEFPEKFNSVITPIAEWIDLGMYCMLNSDTLEFEYIPVMMLQDPEEYKLITGETEEDMDFKYKNWRGLIEIAPLEPSESFEIMENFAFELDDEELRDKLFTALNNRKPFKHFKHLIEHSAYREQWFDFKIKQVEHHVKKKIFVGFTIL